MIEEIGTKDMEALIERHRGALWFQALSLAGKNEDAEDLLQDTLMKVVGNFDSFRPDSNFRAWTRKIMLNIHINRYRSVKTAPMLTFDFSTGELDGAIGDFAEVETVSCTDDPEKVFFQHHIDGCLMEKFYSLPDDFRMPFALYHFEGFSYKQVARMMDIPVGTVKSRISRARKFMIGLAPAIAK